MQWKRLIKKLELWRSFRVHERQIATFPADVREARKHSSRHRTEILASGSCGCFSCISIFPPDQIGSWTDNADGEEEPLWTALCPRCGMDTVIGDRSGFPITKTFLSEMRRYWF
jgi:hypothetical protein